MAHPRIHQWRVVGENLEGWYEIKTDEVYAYKRSGPKVGPGTAWIYKDNTELFGVCEHFDKIYPSSLVFSGLMPTLSLKKACMVLMSASISSVNVKVGPIPQVFVQLST